jgi:hypothetical protein
MKGMPKKNKRVMTPKGEGRIRDVYPLRKTVLVSLPEIGIKEFPIEEIEVLNGSPGNPQQRNKQSQNNGQSTPSTKNNSH